VGLWENGPEGSAGTGPEGVPGMKKARPREGRASGCTQRDVGARSGTHKHAQQTATRRAVMVMHMVVGSCEAHGEG
jgi:hypothetical protein